MTRFTLNLTSTRIISSAPRSLLLHHHHPPAPLSDQAPVSAVMDAPVKKRKGINDRHAEAGDDEAADARVVSIYLSDVDRSEDLPDRIITLHAPTWSAGIGRGSQSDDHMHPQPDNAWYTSKVMSRDHAEITADPTERTVTIKDKGSMHGTFLNGERVLAQPMQLLQDDILTFGTRVVRGVDSFAPLKTIVSFEWADDESPPPPAKEPAFTNTFTADYSDADLASEGDADDDVQFVHESMRQPSVEILEPARVAPPDMALSSPSASPRTDKSADPTSASSVTPPTHSPIVEKQLPAEEPQPAPASPPIDTGSYESASSDYDFDYEEDFGQSELDPLPEFEDDDQEDEMEDDDSDLDQDASSSPGVDPVASSPLAAASVSPFLCNTSSQIVRDPSPSDAAMAKPRGPSPRRCPPFSQPMPPPPPVHFPMAHSTSLNFTPPPPPPPAPPFTPNYNFLGGFSPVDFAGNPYANVPPLVTPPHPSNYFNARVPQQFRPSALNFGRPQTPPRVVDFDDTFRSSFQKAGHIPVENVNETLKRKADEIADDNDHESSIDGEEASTNEMEDHHSADAASDIASSSALVTPKIPVEPQAQSFVRLVESGGDEPSRSTQPERIIIKETELVETTATTSETQEPPRKKVKFDEPIPTAAPKSSFAGSIIKGAAIAFAGAAVGAVGTVVALATLPPDYFL